MRLNVFPLHLNSCEFKNGFLATISMRVKLFQFRANSFQFIACIRTGLFTLINSEEYAEQ